MHKTMVDRLGRHRFLENLDRPLLEVLAGCAMPVVYDAGETIYREGDEADHFFALERGTVAIQIFVTGRGPVTIQTVGPGEVLGWSWLFPPYRRRFDAVAMSTTEGLALRGPLLRERTEADPRLGYELLKRFSRVVVERLHGATVQLADLYGKHP